MKIRKITYEDMPEVYKLVQDLANYEKAIHEVETSPAQFANLFAGQLWDGFALETDNKIVGVTIYYFIFSTWKGKVLYLEDFIVNVDYRGRGFGKLLFDATRLEALKKDCKYMRWQVLDWNKPAIHFYKKYPTQMDGEWINCQINLSL